MGSVYYILQETLLFKYVFRKESLTPYSACLLQWIVGIIRTMYNIYQPSQTQNLCCKSKELCLLSLRMAPLLSYRYTANTV